MDLIIVTERGILGDQEALLDTVGTHHETSCVCVSQQAEVYEMKGEEFVKEARRQDKWRAILA